MNDRWDPNAQLVCPYDPLHVISVKRYQHHIVKCRKNHPHTDFVPCPYNAKHVVLRNELKTHLARCADRVVLEHDILKGQCPETGESFRLKGNTDIPKGNYHVPEASENWDDEIEINLSQQYEDKRNEHIRRHQENSTALRRPNMESSSNTNNKANNMDDDYNDDTISVISHSSKASSLYVDPLKWNTINHRTNSTTPTPTAPTPTNINNNKTKAIGRGLLMKKVQNSGPSFVNNAPPPPVLASRHSCGNDPGMQGVRRINQPPVHNRSFGRGKVKQAYEAYTSSQW